MNAVQFFKSRVTLDVKGQSPDQGHSPNGRDQPTARQSRRLTAGGEAVPEIDASLLRVQLKLRKFQGNGFFLAGELRV